MANRLLARISVDDFFHKGYSAEITLHGLDESQEMKFGEKPTQAPIYLLSNIEYYAALIKIDTDSVPPSLQHLVNSFVASITQWSE